MIAPGTALGSEEPLIGSETMVASLEGVKVAEEIEIPPRPLIISVSFSSIV